MERYTYIDKTTGQRIYSERYFTDREQLERGIEMVIEIRGGIPHSMEK